MQALLTYNKMDNEKTNKDQSQFLSYFLVPKSEILMQTENVN